MLDTQDNDQLEEPVSVRESLEAALKEAGSEDVNTSDQDALSPESDDPQGGSDNDPAASRSRDETGKFTKKEDQSKVTTDGKQDGPDDKQEDSESSGAPSSWNGEGRVLFDKADPALQNYIRTREGQMHEGVAKLKQEYEGKANFADEMWREVSPYQKMIEAEGGTPALAVRDLLGMAALMRTGTTEQKRQLLLNTARQFGVNLSSENSEQSQEPPQAAHDPRFDAIENTLRAMMTRDEQQTRATLESDVAKFAADNPHFEEVRGEMAKLIEAGIATDLQDAYERAVWLNPGVREKVQGEVAEKAAKEKEAKAREQAEKARKASGSVTGAPGLAGNGGSQAPAPTLRGELERAMSAGRA